jgi:hypothetical protein
MVPPPWWVGIGKTQPRRHWPRTQRHAAGHGMRNAGAGGSPWPGRQMQSALSALRDTAPGPGQWPHSSACSSGAALDRLRRRELPGRARRRAARVHVAAAVGRREDHAEGRVVRVHHRREPAGWIGRGSGDRSAGRTRIGQAASTGPGAASIGATPVLALPLPPPLPHRRCRCRRCPPLPPGGRGPIATRTGRRSHPGSHHDQRQARPRAMPAVYGAPRVRMRPCATVGAIVRACGRGGDGRPHGGSPSWCSDWPACPTRPCCWACRPGSSWPSPPRWWPGTP